MEQKRGRLAWVLDFSFRELVTIKIIGVLYAIGMFFSAIIALLFIIAGFADSVGMGILALILSPLVFLLLTLITRVYLELVAVFFRIEKNTEELVRQRSSQSST